MSEQSLLSLASVLHHKATSVHQGWSMWHRQMPSQLGAMLAQKLESSKSTCLQYFSAGCFFSQSLEAHGDLAHCYVQEFTMW